MYSGYKYTYGTNTGGLFRCWMKVLNEQRTQEEEARDGKRTDTQWLREVREVKGGVEWEWGETERGRERENKPHQWAGHTALPNCLKKSPLCFIYSALYPWQPERSGKLGLRFTLLWGLEFHRGSQMWGRWAKEAHCSPSQPSCLLVKSGPFGGSSRESWEYCGNSGLWWWSWEERD